MGSWGHDTIMGLLQHWSPIMFWGPEGKGLWLDSGRWALAFSYWRVGERPGEHQPPSPEPQEFQTSERHRLFPGSICLRGSDSVLPPEMQTVVMDSLWPLRREFGGPLLATKTCVGP